MARDRNFKLPVWILTLNVWKIQKLLTAFCQPRLGGQHLFNLFKILVITALQLRELGAELAGSPRKISQK